MKFLETKMYRILIIIMLIIWGFITFSSIFSIYPAFIGDSTKLSPIVILFGVVVLLLLLVIIYKKISKYDIKRHNVIALCLCLISFVIMCIWGISYKTRFTYDLNHLEDQVQVLLNQKSMNIGYSKYLSVYPFQMSLVCLIYFVKFFATIIHVNPDNFMIVYNCFMVSLSSWFLYKTIKELFDSKTALIGLILMLLVPDFYLYASYYYTDIISIPYAIIAFYCLVRADKSNKKSKYLYRILGGILFAIAFKLRVVCVFLLIAYILCYLFKDSIKQNIKRFVPVMISFVCLILIYNNVILPKFKLEIDEKLTLPSMHWIMMGANSKYDGGYSSEDFNLTFNSENKLSTNVSEYKKRLRKFDLKLIPTKIRRVWSQGDHDVNRKYKNLSNVDSVYKYLNGAACIFIKYIQQIILVTIYVLFLFTIVFELRNKITLRNSRFSVFIVSIFGAILFYLFWEAQSRYSFTFIPWIILGASYSIISIKKILEIKKISFDNFNVSTAKIKKVSFGTIICCTILGLIYGFIYCCIKKENRNYIKYSQYSTNSYIDLIDDELKQSFSINSSFNIVELSFKKQGNVENLKYHFELYNDQDELIHELEFNGDWASKGSVAKLKIPTQKVKNKTKYYFKIYSEDATEENYLRIGVSTIDSCQEKELTTSNVGYDVNEDGDTYINDELICPELRFKIMENKKGAIVSKKVYIFISIVAFSLTLYATYIIFIKDVKEENNSVKKVSKNKKQKIENNKKSKNKKRRN